MKIIDAKCPKCKKVIKVDADSDSTKCDYCGKKIDVKDALVEMMMDETTDKDQAKVKEKEILEEDIETELEEESEVEEDIEESIEDEKTLDEETEEKKENKKTTGENKKTFAKDLNQAEELFKKRSFKEAAESYKLALEINSKDNYCSFMYYYSLFLANIFDFESLNKAYEKMFELDYYIDENGEKNFEVVNLQDDFIATLYRQVYNTHENIKGKTISNLERIKGYFNFWYKILYILEKLNCEDLDSVFKVKVLAYIIKTIGYLSETYYCGENSKTKFRDVANLETLKEKKTKYIGQLKKIDPSYMVLIDRVQAEIVKTANKISKERFRELSFKDKVKKIYETNSLFRWIVWIAITVLIILVKQLLDV